MVVNFSAYVISQGMRKLPRTPLLIIIKKKKQHSQLVVLKNNSILNKHDSKTWAYTKQLVFVKIHRKYELNLDARTHFTCPQSRQIDYEDQTKIS